MFIGCLPFYGFHLLLVAIAGWVLGLNRLRMYVAANISNPLFAPALIFAEIQIGAWFRRAEFHDLTLDAVRNTDLSVFGVDLLIGSVLIGSVLGIVIAVATLAVTAHVPQIPRHIEAIFASAADRYFEHSITAWEFARGKLRRDPVYRTLVEGGLHPGHTLVDIGCGQGLALAAVAEARRHAQEDAWPAASVPPVFTRMVGIESRARVARLAARALAFDAEIVHDSAPGGLPSTISAALLLDVLHLMDDQDQQRLLNTIAARLEPGGILLVREADAAGGWRFQAVRFGNRLKNTAIGNWRQAFHFRSVHDWQQLFVSTGWIVDAQPMAEGTPFANVLFRLTRLHKIADSHDQAR
jgi:SAM-dependent methyltransferase